MGPFVPSETFRRYQKPSCRLLANVSTALGSCSRAATTCFVRLLPELPPHRYSELGLGLKPDVLRDLTRGASGCRGLRKPGLGHEEPLVHQRIAMAGCVGGKQVVSQLDFVHFGRLMNGTVS